MDINQQLEVIGKELRESRENLYPLSSLRDLALNHIGISDKKLRAMEQGQIRNIFDLVKVAKFYKWKEIKLKI